MDRESLESALAEVFERIPAEHSAGRILKPLREGFLGALALDAAEQEELDWFEDTGDWWELAERACDVPLEFVVRCWNPSSMASGEWGLKRLELGSTGYFIDNPDSDFVGERPFWLLGGWEPVDDVVAYQEAFLDTYLRSWDQIGLPPFRGEIAQGPRDLMLAAIEQLVQEGHSWEEFVRDALGYDDPDESFAARVGDRSSLDKAVVDLALAGHATDLAPAARDRMMREAFLEIWEDFDPALFRQLAIDPVARARALMEDRKRLEDERGNDDSP